MTTLNQLFVNGKQKSSDPDMVWKTLLWSHHKKESIKYHCKKGLTNWGTISQTSVWMMVSKIENNSFWWGFKDFPRCSCRNGNGGKLISRRIRGGHLEAKIVFEDVCLSESSVDMSKQAGGILPEPDFDPHPKKAEQPKWPSWNTKMQQNWTEQMCTGYCQ